MNLSVHTPDEENEVLKMQKKAGDTFNYDDMEKTKSNFGENDEITVVPFEKRDEFISPRTITPRTHKSSTVTSAPRTSSSVSSINLPEEFDHDPSMKDELGCESVEVLIWGVSPRQQEEDRKEIQKPEPVAVSPPLEIN
jgi:hypothetical protein